MGDSFSGSTVKKLGPAPKAAYSNSNLFWTKEEARKILQKPWFDYAAIVCTCKKAILTEAS